MCYAHGSGIVRGVGIMLSLLEIGLETAFCRAGTRVTVHWVTVLPIVIMMPIMHRNPAGAAAMAMRGAARLRSCNDNAVRRALEDSEDTVTW